MLKNSNYSLKFDRNGWEVLALTFDEYDRRWELYKKDKNISNSWEVKKLVTAFKHKDHDLFISHTDIHNSTIHLLNNDKVVKCLENKNNGVFYGFKHNNKTYYFKDFLNMYENDHFIK